MKNFDATRLSIGFVTFIPITYFVNTSKSRKNIYNSRRRVNFFHFQYSKPIFKILKYFESIKKILSYFEFIKKILSYFQSIQKILSYFEYIKKNSKLFWITFTGTLVNFYPGNDFAGVNYPRYNYTRDDHSRHEHAARLSIPRQPRSDKNTYLG